MAPGTWNAPQENDTVAWAGGVAYCSRPTPALTRSNISRSASYANPGALWSGSNEPAPLQNRQRRAAGRDWTPGIPGAPCAYFECLRVSPEGLAARVCENLPAPADPQAGLGTHLPGHLADLSHVLARWHADEQYIDADGRPVLLPLEGPEPSLSGLVSRVLPSTDPAQAIQWLTELKGIRREGKRFLPTDKYLAFNRLPMAAWAHGLAAVLGMLRTVEHNVSAPPQSRLLERMAVNPRFPVRALPQFHRELKRQAGEIVWRFDSDMRREEVRAARASPSRASVLGSMLLKTHS